MKYVRRLFFVQVSSGGQPPWAFIHKDPQKSSEWGWNSSSRGYHKTSQSIVKG